MVSAPTVADVAREAGVSVATVDRVVNGRLPVREDTTRRVLDAAQRLGFHAAGLIRARLREQLPEVTVGLLLQRPEEPFYAISRPAGAGDDRQPGVPRGSPDSITGPRTTRTTSRRALRRLGRRCQAVALVSPDHPAVAAAIGELAAARDAGLHPALGLRPGGADKLSRHRQPQGRAHGWLADPAMRRARRQGRR